MIIQTKVTDKNKIKIPEIIRKKLNINAGDELQWFVILDELTIRKAKDLTWEDMIGIIESDEPTDCVALKKKLYKGE